MGDIHVFPVVEPAMRSTTVSGFDGDPARDRITHQDLFSDTLCAVACSGGTHLSSRSSHMAGALKDVPKTGWQDCEFVTIP